MQLLQPLHHQMPRTQQQYDELLERMRSVGHIAERSPGNIAGVFGRGRGHSTTRGFYTALTTDATPGDGHAADGPANNIWADPGETALFAARPNTQAGADNDQSWGNVPTPSATQPSGAPLWGDESTAAPSYATSLADGFDLSLIHI